MSESDGKLNGAYRSLAREEPPASLDAAILAASRAAVAKPSFSRRFAAPVSIAAVLVLALGVTLRMQQERPGIESPDMDSVRRDAPATPAAPPPAPQQPPAEELRRQESPAPKPVPEKKAALPQAKRDAAESVRAFRDEARVQEESKELKDTKEQAPPVTAKLAKDANVSTPVFTPPPPAAPQAAPAPAAPAAAAAAPAARMKREAFGAAQAPAATSAASAADAQPMDEATRELEAIAKLRAESRHEEADKALAEFRRKRPDYRIPDAMWERVKPR